MIVQHARYFIPAKTHASSGGYREAQTLGNGAWIHTVSTQTGRLGRATGYLGYLCTMCVGAETRRGCTAHDRG